MDHTFFKSWESILRIIYVTPIAYVAIVILLRVSGKRTLSKMNAFDLVITIALGSVLASVVLYNTIPLADGITAFIVLIGFQFMFTWLSVRIKAIRSILTSQPTLIFYKGNFQYPAMKNERITHEEVYSAARQKGFSTLEGVDIIILETTGDISIIEKITNPSRTIFENVEMEQ